MLQAITEQLYLWLKSLLIKDFTAEKFFDWTQSKVYTQVFCFKHFLYLKACFLNIVLRKLCPLCHATSVCFEINKKKSWCFQPNDELSNYYMLWKSCHNKVCNKRHRPYLLCNPGNTALGLMHICVVLPEQSLHFCSDWYMQIFNILSRFSLRFGLAFM